MNCAETERILPGAARPGPCCVVGYGNRERGDDGLGPLVAEMVRFRLGRPSPVRVLARPSLDVDLLEEVAEAELLILVDATVEYLPQGRRWQRVEPNLGDAPMISHQLSPAYLLGLWEMMLGRAPETWLVAVAGEKFDWGRDISAPARERAARLADELVNLLCGRSEHGNRG